MINNRRFNVVFTWNDLEYKLLNLYDIAYYKCFECEVEHAVYQASISVKRKLRLRTAHEQVFLAGPFSCEKYKHEENNNFKLEIYNLSAEKYNYWKQIEIKLYNPVLGEEIFWKTMEIINLMQSMSVYCLL